jgi:hypothetical protein
MLRVIVAIFVGAFVAAPAIAASQSPDPNVTVFVPSSAGMPSCGTWTASRTYRRSGGEAAQYEKWVMGFESGLNWAQSAGRGDVLRDTDADAAFGWIDQYCRAHPLESLLWAVVNLDRELANRRRPR